MDNCIYTDTLGIHLQLDCAVSVAACSVSGLRPANIECFYLLLLFTAQCTYLPHLSISDGTVPAIPSVRDTLETGFFNGK